MSHSVTLKTTRRGTLVATLELTPEQALGTNGTPHRVPLCAKDIDAGLRELGIQLRRETYVLMKGTQIDPDAIGEQGP